MAQPPKGGLVRGYDKPIHGSWAIYFPGGINSSNFFQATLTSFVSIDNKFSGSTFSGSESELSLCAGFGLRNGAQDALNVAMKSICLVNVSWMYLFDSNFDYQLFLKMCRNQLDFCCVYLKVSWLETMSLWHGKCHRSFQKNSQIWGLWISATHGSTNGSSHCWWKKSCTPWDVKNPVIG